MNALMALAPELPVLPAALPGGGHRQEDAGGFAAVFSLLLQQAFPAGVHLAASQREALPETEHAFSPAGEPVRDRGQNAGPLPAELALPALLAHYNLPGMTGDAAQRAAPESLLMKQLLVATALAGQAGKAPPGGSAAPAFAAEKTGGAVQAVPAAAPATVAGTFAETLAGESEAYLPDNLAATAAMQQAGPPPLPAGEHLQQPVLENLTQAGQEALPEKVAGGETGREIRLQPAESPPAADRKEAKQAEATQAVSAAPAESDSAPAAAKAPEEGGKPAVSTDAVEQILEKIEFSARKNGEQRLYVRLKPETLGEVEIRLKLEAGRLTAKIVTDNIQVKELLDASLPQISRRLEAQQVTLTAFSVTVGQEQNPGRQAETWQQGYNVRQPVQEQQAAGDVPVAAEAAGRVNILA